MLHLTNFARSSIVLMRQYEIVLHDHAYHTLHKCESVSFLQEAIAILN